MKKALLFFCIPLFVVAAEPPRLVPLRTDSRQSRSLHLIDLASKNQDCESRITPPLPKSTPIVDAVQTAKKPLKMVTVSVNVWRNDPCDEQLWQEILQEYYQLKNAPFSTSELFAGITAFIKLTEEKKGQALWGGLSFTELPDSQKIDNKKAPEQP